MTKEEAKKILTDYVKACKEDDFLTLDGFVYEEVIEAMSMGAEALSEPSLSSDIEEAIFTLCAIDVPVGHTALIDEGAHNAIQMAIDALSKPSLPSNLDEAAKNYCEKVNHRQTTIITDSFKAGAEWMAGQGVTKEAVVDRTTLNRPDGITTYLYDFDGRL